MATAASAGEASGQGSEGSRREIITPEGVPLHLDLAQRGERAAAVIIDLLIVFGIIFVPTLLVAVASADFSLSGWGLAFVLLISFAVRSFYFIFFELRWHGTTPGKRALGLRVIDRAGGRLRSDAVFARNLMREVELFIPLSLLASGDQIGSAAWVVVLTLVWTSVFTLMPFFNKDRMRVGDIIGGTWVISAPKSVLLPDMAGAAAGETPRRGAEPSDYVFSKEQLEVYGIYELQTLENVLRQHGPDAGRTQHAVARRIRRKIGWTQIKPVDSRRFLEAFYAALRAHLETKMLFGVRRKDKHDRH